LLAEALRIAHHCLLGPEHVSTRRALAVELTKASFRTERRSDLLMGLLWQTADAYCAGDPHAGRLLGELKDHLGQRDHLAVGFVASAIDVMLAIRAGRFDEAEALAAVCAGRGAAAGDPDHDWWSAAQLVTMRGAVEAACLLDEADVAARAYELLRPHANLPMIGSLGITCFGSVQHALGVAALTTGRLDLAIEHLTAAVQHNLALAHWPALVASRQRLAQAHALRGGPGDADAARRELDAATADAASAGLPA